MKKARKALLTLCAALLLVSMTVGVTVAYLTSTTAPVTNTFTVGNVAITLDEAPVDANGEATNGARVTQNSYKLLPGHDYDKDPTIHVAAGSEACWLFVKVVDELVDIQDANTIAAQLAANGWTLVAGKTDVYAYESIANAGQNVVVFETFKVKGDVNNATLATYNGKTIKVTAYAVQADGFDTSAAAWDAAPKADTEW